MEYTKHILEPLRIYDDEYTGLIGCIYKAFGEPKGTERFYFHFKTADFRGDMKSCETYEEACRMADKVIRKETARKKRKEKMVQNWIEEVMRSIFGSKKELTEAIIIGDDESYTIPEEYQPKLFKEWDRVLLSGSNLGDDKLETLAYNLTIASAFMWLNDGELREEVFDVTVSTIVICSIVRACRKEKLVYPRKYWDFVSNWIREHGDWVDKLANSRLDTEAEVTHQISKIVENAFEKEGDNND